MIQEFYGFSNLPFTRDIPEDKLFLTKDQEEILGRLFFAAKNHWFAVLTGDCGSGKSTLLRRFCHDLNPNTYKIFYLADSQLTPRHFYNGILRQMGVDGAFYRGDSKKILHRELGSLIALKKQQPVILVDEAHLLSKEMLEEIRFLLNFDIDSKSPLALILSGQTELMEKLRRQSYTAISQRVNLFCQTRYFDRGELEHYIQKQLDFAGYTSEIFAKEAMDSIFDFTSGCPRLINRLCTHLLLYGAQRERKILTASDVESVQHAELP